jgi:membrane fusion protein (multidrug efflux system)
MKNKIIYLSLITVFFVACSAPDNKAQLEKLKKQKADLETQIASLEELVAKSDTSKKEIKIIEITTIPVKAQTFKTYIEVQGRIDADENVSLSSEIPGTITKINVKVGDEVSKGQVLAETDTRAIQQQMSDLQTSLDFASQVFEKQKKLWDEKIGTEIQYLQAKNTKESLEKKMSTMQEQLRMSKIISPINGNVDAVNVKIGQAIAPGIPAIGVINFNNLKVKADVAESYASRIKTGNEVRIVFPDMNDSLTSKVNYASRAINAMTRTFNVEVILDNKKEYHPNMVAVLKINDYQSATPQLIVAEKYIQKGANESFIMIAENGKAVKKSITINHQYNGNAEITSGLKDGDLIITEGYDLVNDGDAIKIK